jgi:hypothetical protein
MFVHHDFQELSDGRILFLGGEQLVLANPMQGGKPTRMLGDGLFVVDLTTGRQEQVWSSFNHLNLRERPSHWLGAASGGLDSWTHANSLSLGPRGNVIVSLAGEQPVAQPLIP